MFKRRFFVLVLLFTPITSAEESVVKFGRPNPGVLIGSVCSYMPELDERCKINLYSEAEVKTLIATAQASAVSECQTRIDSSKAEIVSSINKLSPDVLASIKAEVKDQIKAEVKAELLRELSDDIKTGKLRFPVEPAKKTAR
jgi:hypothetical protein